MNKIIFPLIALVFVFGCIQSQSIEPKTIVEGVQKLVPTDWKLEPHESFGSELAYITLSSEKKCFGAFKIGNYINPTIDIVIENKWTEKEFKEEKQKNDNCKEELEKYPSQAVACIERKPSIDVKNYSVFVSANECETSELQEKIMNYLKELQ